MNRVIYSKIESVKDISDIDHPSVRECLKYYGIPNGISISHDGDLPARSGIGSSSSFTVGLINAIHTYLGYRKVSEFQLARLLKEKYKFCFVSIHEESLSYSLLTLDELEKIIKNLLL